MQPKSRSGIPVFYINNLLSITYEFRSAHLRGARGPQDCLCPYSRFQVGAALRTASGRIFCGCNVENLSFGLTVCAERAAVFAAVAAGETKFEAIAVVADSVQPVTPCGACRQVLPSFPVTCRFARANLQDDRYESTIAELLPSRQGGYPRNVKFHVEQPHVRLSQAL
ncbi:MAG: cytidine deaminase [Chthoniobacter sp.]